MKRELWFGALAIAVAVIVAAGCMTQARQNLYDEGGDTSRRIADVFGRYQATSFDNALAAANDGLKLWTEKRGAFLVEQTTANKLEDPWTVRILAWYDNVLRSIQSDIDFLTALKAKADAIKPAQ